ncbi:hypothetical protein PPTG_20841 [Phytophthora nicotianae INRA-310]|uniref:Uncharacterized protein n=1 Tax=Phytophthora nicotianae (strain INRA-310) TaxID=761204 RepID=W2RJV7_PHYN3|nr:hypothetical protein PPTG_20841 [Phytophthora nicotianae INRA-310]ETN24890.1 hypothetical protein PPTG_20841 [Phytophthora nicotianae INRA-310]
MVLHFRLEVHTAFLAGLPGKQGIYARSYQQSATSCMCPPSFAQYPGDVVKYQLTEENLRTA